MEKVAPREGLEPPRLAAARQQHAASSNFAIWDRMRRILVSNPLRRNISHVL